MKEQWGLPGPLCLVEFEVNDGLGMPRVLREDRRSSYTSWVWMFVATRITCVEGSAEYPLRVQACSHAN